MSDGTRVIHLTQTVGSRSYGAGQVATHLAGAQRQSGAVAEVWTFDSPDELAWAARHSALPTGQMQGFARSWPAVLGRSRAMEKAALAARWDGRVVVHQHLLWLLISRVPALLRAAGAVRVVIAPHGTLDDWALRKSRWKKRLARCFYEGRNLAGADCLQATSEREIGNFRDFGLRNPIALINNGVSQEWLASTGDAQAFRRAHGLGSDRRILLFISRIARQKGLLMLLDAMQRLRPHLADWTLIVAGLDEQGHEAEVKARVRELGWDERVRFVGPLFAQAKRDALAATEVFVLPSHSEGAPMIVLEALAAGVPVLTTHSAPWADLERCRCGWWCDISVEAIGAALEDVATLSRERREAMGQRARALVASDYTWQESARKTLELYTWLHEGGTPPGFVVSR
jgi:glycosyltransferase involved in cell wall biosynthesis